MVKKWQIIHGTKPILLVASHNFPHLRNGVIKPRDVGTGNLVEVLCENTDSWGIVSEKIQEDPNWYAKSDFRHKVIEIIKDENIQVTLDIHGRKLGWPRLIDFYPNVPFCEKFLEYLTGLSVRKFKEDTQFSLSENLAQMDIPALMVEIRRDGREVGTKEYEVVTNLIKKLISKLGQEVI